MPPLLALEDLLPGVTTIDATGSVTITYNGVANSLVAYEGIEDRKAGYSASPRLMELNPGPDAAPQQGTQVTLAAPGVMIGAPDPAMLFPQQTSFQPYAYRYNLSNQSIAVDISIKPFSGAAGSRLGTFTLAPGQTASAAFGAMLQRSTIPLTGEYADLIFSYQGHISDIDVETGSTDQSRNYVFEVFAMPEVPTISKTICYWTVSDGNDSMISVWNYSDHPADELLTLFFARGKYELLIHLAPGETRVVSVHSLQQSQAPDADGNVIPVNIAEGSALLSSGRGETVPMSVVVNSATFNVRNATCGPV